MSSTTNTTLTPSRVFSLPGENVLPHSTDVLTESSTMESKSVGVKNNGEIFSGRAVTMEEAIRLTGHGKFHITLLIVSGCLFMSGVLDTIIISFLLPSASCELDMDDNDKGLLGASLYIGMALASHSWGLIADTQGRRKALLWATILEFLSSMLSSLAPNYLSLLLLRFLCGVFTSGPFALCFTYFGEFHTPDTRIRSSLFVGSFGPLGAALIPAVAWAVLRTEWGLNLGFVTFSPWRLLLVLSASTGLLTAIMLGVLLPESPKFLFTRDPQQALAVLRIMYAKNTGNAPQEYPVTHLIGTPGSEPTESTITLQAESTESEKKTSSLGLERALRTVWRQTAPLFRPPYLWHTCLVCFLQFGNLASLNGLQIWIPEIFNQLAKFELVHEGEPAEVCKAYNFEHLHTIESRSMALAMDSSRCKPVIKDAVFINSIIIGVPSVAFPLLCSTIVHILGKRNLLVLSLLLAGLCNICLTVVTSSSQLLGLCCVIIPINAMGIGHISSIVVELFPTNVRAMAVSLHMMCGRLGSIVGNLIFGALLAHHCPLAFYAIGGALLTCSVLSCCLPVRGKFAA